jgi:hypothetical protein
MQHYKPFTRSLSRLLVLDRNPLRPFASLASTSKTTPDKTTTTLSNRQKFNQIQPPIKLYEKLDKLGFGTLLKTKRFSGVHKQREKRDQQRLQHTERVGPPPEPKYAVTYITLSTSYNID